LDSDLDEELLLLLLEDEWCLEPEADEELECALLCTFLYDELLLLLALKLFLPEEELLWCLLDDLCRCLRTRIFRCFSFKRRSKSDDADDEWDEELDDECRREKLLCAEREDCFRFLLMLTELEDELLE